MRNYKGHIPKNLNDYRLRHYNAFEKYNSGIGSDEDKIALIAGITGVPFNVARMIEPKEFNQVMKRIDLSFIGIKLSKPPKEVVIGGKHFTLVDPHKVGMGWHRDFANINRSQHAMMSAMFYVEKGMKYAQCDEDGNILNSVIDRAKFFETHFPMALYLDASAFFLNKIILSTNVLIQVKKISLLKNNLVKRLRISSKTKQSTI